MIRERLFAVVERSSCAVSSEMYQDIICDTGQTCLGIMNAKFRIRGS